MQHRDRIAWEDDACPDPSKQERCLAIPYEFVLDSKLIVFSSARPITPCVFASLLLTGASDGKLQQRKNISTEAVLPLYPRTCYLIPICISATDTGHRQYAPSGLPYMQAHLSSVKSRMLYGKGIGGVQ